MISLEDASMYQGLEVRGLEVSKSGIGTTDNSTIGVRRENKI